MNLNWKTIGEYAIAIVIGMAIYNLLDALVLDKVTDKIVSKFEE